MASFFQPGINDPAIAACDPGRFKIYCNSIVPSQRLLHTWYQTFNLSVGAAAFFIPLALILLNVAVRTRFSNPLQFRRLRKRKKDFSRNGGTPPPMTAFKAAKSFRVFEESDGLSVQGEQRDYDLVMLPLIIGDALRDGDSISRSSHLAHTNGAAKTNIACVNFESLRLQPWDDEGNDPDELSRTASFLADLQARSSLGGIALRCSPAQDSKKLNALLEVLYFRGVPILLLSNHDSDVWLTADISYTAGVIIENACILPNGQRRDYFKAKSLRDVMAICSRERETRPEYFVGFLDLWEQRPHPSLIRRALKLAEHFGAVYEHGPASPAVIVGGPLKSAAQTLSGFEYLRRIELTELQKAWTTETRKVWAQDSDVSPDVSYLYTEGLRSAIPEIDEFLQKRDLPPSMELFKDEVVQRFDPPSYTKLAPLVDSFWEYSVTGQKLSSRGCYPMSTETFDEHFDHVVSTQTHLKELQLLQPVKGAELHRLLQGYQKFAAESESHELVHGLIDGLETHQICVYKGLDTGFGVPEGVGYFWGVSHLREESSDHPMDIFISLKAPNDATAVLHTWLAHYGVPRQRRFELEFEFEITAKLVDEIHLPINLKTNIDRSSPAEVLALLQLIRVSGEKHPFLDALKDLGEAYLIAETSTSVWQHRVARKTIDGSDIRELLKERLEYYVRHGATSLPSLEALTSLYEVVYSLVEDSLFFGNRDSITIMLTILTQAWDPINQGEKSYNYIDINTDLFTLIFFAVMRKAAFEDVYVEATDRCPFFLSQPDQAAVFSELWVLGSQCEIYFGILPRELGDVVYNRYRLFLEKDPPVASARVKNEIMTMYSNAEPDPDVEREKKLQRDGSSTVKLTSQERLGLWRKRMTEVGAMSIFCMPAIIDVLLLTFVGRGIFMTAFMDPLYLQAAGLALLIGLLITAGVTGWVGSTGNYYQCNYAYDNMIWFHIERLSGGFILTIITAIGGLVGFSVQYSVSVGFIFAAYLVIIATYFNLIGVMATMHQHQSPITSGRTVLWRTFPLLLLSPVLSSVVNDHDIEIYLPVTFSFLVLVLYQYRRLCHEWSGWMDNIPNFSEKDVTEWYSAKVAGSASDNETPQVQPKDAQEALRQAISGHQRGVKEPGSNSSSDKFVARIANGMPYVEWLFKKTCPGGKIPDAYSASWFTQLGESRKQQRQLARGLKEHNILMLFRFARYDLGQNLGLFLVALMDRWVSIVMGARSPRPTLYIDARARYGICFCILYFCFSVMLLDTTLQGYWDIRYRLSTEKLANYEHAEAVSKLWERHRLRTFGKALAELFAKIGIVFGGTTLLLWLLVETPQTIIIYYLYCLGYTGVIVFQFNRCFTTNVRAHITIILTSAAIGFIIGVALRSIPLTANWIYGEIISQNIASVLAATGTSLWAWKDWSSPAQSEANGSVSGPHVDMYFQNRLGTESGAQGQTLVSKTRGVKGTAVMADDGTYLAQEVKSLLRKSLDSPNTYVNSSPWSFDVLQKAVNMWTGRQITVTASTRERFIRSGLEDVSSFSELVSESLNITVGYLGEDEIRKTSWQKLHATLVAESVLFHVARAHFRMHHTKAIMAEHFLGETVILSHRLDFEISLDDSSNLNRISSRTGIELMKHLCLDLTVDASWGTLPESVRRAIMSRINGVPVISDGEFSQFITESGIDLPTADFHVNLCLQIFQKVSEKGLSSLGFTKSGPSQPKLSRALLRPVKINRSRAPGGALQHWLRLPVLIPVNFVKWVAIISGAGSDIERELWYLLKGVYFRQVILRFILLLWKFCWVMKNLWIYAIVIYQHPALEAITRLAQKGARRKLKGSSIIVELPRKTITGFANNDDAGNFVLEVFDGSLKDKPSGKDPMFKAVYDEQLRLQSRVDNGTATTTYNYQSNDQLRWPVSKEFKDENFQTVGFYDKYGRITRGTLAIGDKEFAFQYHYKETPRGSTDVLSADFKQIEPPSDDMFSVFWGLPLDSDLESFDWVPSERICRLVKVINGRTYVTEAEYQHRRDPFITTFLKEESGRNTAIASAPKVFEEETLFLARPNNVSFDLDDLLIYHNKLQIRQMRRLSGRKPTPFTYLNPLSWLTWWGRRVYQPIPTWRIRTELWNLWLKTESINAPTACWIDELALREEPLLHAYWAARDAGRLLEAKAVLDRNTDQIVSAIDIQTDVSEVCLLPIRMSDLYAMGLGKDATQVTSRPENCVQDTEDRVSVIFNDIGCWPEAPGGVSNCRRDLVNGHSTIRNHVLAECANDFGIPRFQVEKNVQSLKLLPLWGLDGKTAHHGLIDNLLQSQVDEKISDTDVQRDIVGIFIPLLKDFVKGARTRRYSRTDLIKYSNVMLSMSKYYEHKDYSRTWESKEVEKAWVDAWLISYNDPDIIEPSKCFELERPSMSDFREALGIYLAYFFIFSVKIPDKCPRVFQSTHHGISSLFGMILRYRRGVTFGIWDHAILWRECCLNISPAQCELPISVQSMLLSGIGMATRLAYFHADVIMPCTSLFNPMWEAEIGTDRGKLGSKNVFNRRIDPIVNGISNMESFTPVDKVRTEKPTVVMLSNVQFIKGIKTAILAADIIVNRFGFKDYQLVVYGAKDRQPSYALEMAKLIVENNLSETVILAGFGKPKEVLKDAWLFMNSSISEGLPLAIGEAALAGVPIVATEVGATALVMTDPEDQDQRYGEVVPPNDPVALARAQLSILGMVGPWAKFSSEGPSAATATLPDDITPRDVEWLTQRMYDRSDDRRKLGLLSREVVLHSFHGNRYLREHEQMYWVQWHLAKMRDDANLAAIAAETHRFGTAPPLRYSELAEEEEAEPLLLEYAADMAGGDEGGLLNEAAIKRSKSKKRGSFIRWQDFSTEVPRIEKYTVNTHRDKRQSNRLSKQPPLAVVNEV